MRITGIQASAPAQLGSLEAPAAAPIARTSAAISFLGADAIHLSSNQGRSANAQAQGDLYGQQHKLLAAISRSV